jgi:hypothetical protein
MVNDPGFEQEALNIRRKKESVIKAIWFKILLRNVITTKRHHKEDSMVGCKIMSRCIAFRSLVANCYAQSINITSEQALLQKQFLVSAGNRSLVPASKSDTLCVIQKWPIFGVSCC